MCVVISCTSGNPYFTLDSHDNNRCTRLAILYYFMCATRRRACSEIFFCGRRTSFIIQNGTGIFFSVRVGNAQKQWTFGWDSSHFIQRPPRASDCPSYDSQKFRRSVHPIIYCRQKGGAPPGFVWYRPRPSTTPMPVIALASAPRTVNLISRIHPLCK